MTEERTDQQVDELYEKVSEPASSDIQMKEPKAQSLDPELFEFTANGKQIKATKDDVLKWASQGHDYSQKMESFKSERGEFDTQYNSYKEIDEYAKNNPDWWQQVQDSYANKDQAPQDNPELAQVMEKLSGLEQFKEEFVNAKMQEQISQQDQALDTEVKSIREQYPSLDWASKNEEGHNLEQQVLKHSQDKGLGDNFKASFRDYMFPKLIASAEERGKETVGRDLAKKTKLGLLGESQTPTKGLKDAGYTKNKTYEQLMQEGLDEIPSMQPST